MNNASELKDLLREARSYVTAFKGQCKLDLIRRIDAALMRAEAILVPADYDTRPGAVNYIDRP